MFLLSCVFKNALTGTNVNNPFWWSDDKFFNNSLADTLEYHLPNGFTASAEHPTDTTGKSFRNNSQWTGKEYLII
jgi:hypothetical protein